MDRKQMVKRHATRYVCPSGSEPQTPYEVNMINNLILFGNELLDAALEAEAGRVRAEVRQLVDDLAEEVWGDIEPSGEYTQSDHHFIGETPEYEQLHRELVKRANAFLRATAAPQPETEAEALTFPMTDGPDLPWSLAEEIYQHEAFEWYYPENIVPLKDMVEGGGWSWATIAACWDNYGLASAEQANDERERERMAASYHAAQEGEAD